MSVIAVCRPVSTFPRFRSIWVPVCLRLLACVSRCVSAAWDCLCPDSDQRALLSLTVSSRLTPPDSGQHALIETYRGESYGTRVALSFTPFGRARLCCAGVDRISAICTSFLSALGDGPFRLGKGQPFGTLGACFFSAFRFPMSGLQRQVLPALCCPGLHASGNPAPLSQVCWALGRKRLVLERCCLSFAAQASCSLRTTLCESESNTIV